MCVYVYACVPENAHMDNHARTTNHLQPHARTHIYSSWLLWIVYVLRTVKFDYLISKSKLWDSKEEILIQFKFIELKI